MKRGDVVIMAERGALTGKPRPAVVIQADLFNAIDDWVMLVIIGTGGPDAPSVRIAVLPDETNGLRQPCRIWTDRIVTIRALSVSSIIGVIHPATMRAVDQALRYRLAL